MRVCRLIVIVEDNDFESNSGHVVLQATIEIRDDTKFTNSLKLSKM